MGWAVRQEGQVGYSLGFITFIVLGLLSLSLVWVLKYARARAAVETAHVAPAETDTSMVRSGSTYQPAAAAGRLGENTGSEDPAYRVIIDASRCWDHATSDGNPPCDLCVNVCPEFLEKPHPNASARVRQGVDPGPHLPEIREAIRRCPGNAILLVELVGTEL
jgi:ferredoxin